MSNQKSSMRRTTASLLLIVFVFSIFFTFGLSQEEPSSVASHMKEINKDFRELRRQLKDPEKIDANLALIGNLRQHFRGAREGEPSKARSLPESERNAFVAEYQSLLDQVITTVEKLEKALKDGQIKQAETLLKQLNDQKKSGHGKFQE